MADPKHELRVTPWVDVIDKPAWSDSAVSAYRIWQRVSQWGWEQRHEWRYRDGRPDWKEEWIRGISGWTSTAEAVETEDAESI